MSYVKSALSANETILLRVRKHPIVLLMPAIYNILLLMLIGGGAFLAVDTAAERVLPAILSLALLPACVLCYKLLAWWCEEYFITTHRVICSEGILSKRVTDSSLEKINDVVLNQSLIGRLLNFGDVEILTASEKGTNRVERIGSPVQFKTAMLNQKGIFAGDGQQRTHGADGEEPKERISDMISGLEKLRQEGAITDSEFSGKKKELLAQM